MASQRLVPAPELVGKMAKILQGAGGIAKTVLNSGALRISPIVPVDESVLNRRYGDPVIECSTDTVSANLKFPDLFEASSMKIEQERHGPLSFR